MRNIVQDNSYENGIKINTIQYYKIINIFKIDKSMFTWRNILNINIFVGFIFLIRF